MTRLQKLRVWLLAAPMILGVGAALLTSPAQSADSQVVSKAYMQSYVSGTYTPKTYTITCGSGLTGCESFADGAQTITVAPSGITMGGDVSGTAAATVVDKVNGTSYGAGGALTTGQVPRVTGGSTVAYGALDLNNTNATTSQLLASRGGTGADLSSGTGFARMVSGTGSVRNPIIYDTVTNILAESSPFAGQYGIPSGVAGGFPLVYSGSAWMNVVGYRRCARPPAVAGMTWVNQGTATAADSNSGWALGHTGASASNDRHLLVKSATTSSPYTFTVGFIISNKRGSGAPIPYFGIVVRDSSSQKFTAAVTNWSTSFTMEWSKWSSVTTSPGGAYANYTAETSTFGVPFWIRFVDDGTNLNAWYSWDGTMFHRYLATDTARADYVPSGGDQIGVVMQEISNNSSSVSAEVFEWSFTNP